MMGGPPRSRRFTAEDLARGELIDAAYLVLFGRVFDLGARLRSRGEGRAARLLRGFVGQDVSRLFNARTGRPARPHPLLALETRAVDAEELGLAGLGEAPWWEDESLVAGAMTAEEVHVRVVNTLTFHEQVLRVACEETLDEIAERYLPFNAHARSYVWKDVDGRHLDLYATLAANQLWTAAPAALPPVDCPQPLLLLHFSDDLSEL